MVLKSYVVVNVLISSTLGFHHPRWVAFVRGQDELKLVGIKVHITDQPTNSFGGFTIELIISALHDATRYSSITMAKVDITPISS
jgi:hypothetical protein